MTLNDALNEFLLQKRLAGLLETSLHAYEMMVGIMIHYIGDIELSKLTYEQVNAYILHLFEQNLSRSTLASYIRNARIFLRFVQVEYGLSFNPAKIKVPKSPKKIVHIYTDKEIQQLFSTIKTSIPWMTARNCAIIALMLDSGLRQAEVCTLQKRNINPERMTIKVMGKGAKERLVPLGHLTKNLLKEYIEICPYKSDYVFVDKRGLPLSGNAIRLFVSKLQRKLPFDLSSHKLRHNFATNYCLDHLQKDGNSCIYDLSILMGHESIDTTKRYEHFAHEIIASQKNISHLDRIFDKK